MDRIAFTPRGMADFYCFAERDIKTLKKIGKLIEDMKRHPFTGLDKPEPPKNREGYWSRRINEKDRIAYKVFPDFIEIVQYKNHYDDK